MSRSQEFERAFFTSLCDYNAARDDARVLKVGLLAAIMGDPSQRHLRRYYPECARE